jgi:hypothetical protein
MNNSNRATLRLVLIVLGLCACGCSATVSAAYFGENDAVVITRTGCNAASYAQVPGEVNLFIGRQFFKPDGSPVAMEEKCNGPGAREAIQANRWALVLDQLNWQQKSFSIIKPLLVPPAVITAGPLQGATMRAVKDPHVIIYRGKYLISFECGFQKFKDVEGTSACIAVFDPRKQEIRDETVQVVVSGTHEDGGRVFDSASVPALLVVNDRLYIYWSQLTVIPKEKKFIRDTVRAAELEADRRGLFWVKGTGGRIASAIGGNTVEVWAPDSRNALSDTAVDLKSIWLSKAGIVAVVGLGGGGCAKPGPEPGCFRMAMAKADAPLGPHIFNSSPLLDEASLPTNPQGYTSPVKNPEGGYSFMGTFIRPTANGLSELRSVPKDWSGLEKSVTVIFPFPDQNLWPVN